jgi:Ferredoxin-like domain in Api92-like protein
MCDTTLVVRGERTRLAEFLDEIGLDRQILAAAEERMGRLVETDDSGTPVLHRRTSLSSLTAYCGVTVAAPERRWASPAWMDRDPDPEPEMCHICEDAARADSPWADTFDRRGMLSFMDILPLPPGLPPEEDRRWVIEHWGTKWDIAFTGSFIEEEGPEMIRIKIETAWGPPLPIVDEMAHRAPDLEFNVSWEAEPVGAIDEVGEAAWRGGERVHYRARPR